VPCRRVDNITTAPSISRDLALIKVAATGEARTHVLQLVDVYRARIVDVSPESLVIETTGTEDKIDSLVEVLRPTASSRWCGPAASRWRAGSRRSAESRRGIAPASTARTSAAT
jgi:acetolactate synthase small subunit